MVKASDYTCFVGYNIYLAKPATTEEWAKGIVNAISNSVLFVLRVKLLEGIQEIGHLNQHLLICKSKKKLVHRLTDWQVQKKK